VKRTRSVTLKLTAEEWDRMQSAARIRWGEETAALLGVSVVARTFMLDAVNSIVPKKKGSR
jgi:hypothetical protein